MVENARIVCDNICFGFNGVFPLTDFRNCQYDATYGEAEISYMPTRFGQICANPPGEALQRSVKVTPY